MTRKSLPLPAVGPADGPDGAAAPPLDHRQAAGDKAPSAPISEAINEPTKEPIGAQSALPTASLRSRSLKGGAWALGGFAASKALRLASNLILARFLAPEAFGVVAIAISLQIWLEMITDLGVNASVVREKAGDAPAFLDTAWTIQIVRNTAIASCLWIGALFFPVLVSAAGVGAATVFADPALPPIIAIVGVCVFVDGLRSMGFALCQRRLQLDRVVGLELGAQVIATVATISGAFAGLGVYALVLGMLTNAIAMAAGSYVFLGSGRRRIAITAEFRKTIITYGKWLILASTLGFIINRGDQIIFGGLVVKEAFGLYAVATIWITTLRALFSVVQNKVAYPIFSELGRDRPEARTRIYYQIRYGLDAASLAVFVGIVLFAKPVFGFIYPEAFASVADYVKLLSVGVLLFPYNLINTVILCAGDSKRFSGVVAAPGLAVFFGLPTVFHAAGFEAAIVFAALVNVFAMPFMFWFARRLLTFRPLYEAGLVAAAFGAAIWTLGGLS
ncbi:MAG: oligosaccharide flippase family protein [Pseudomonadota bacterium]